MQTPPEAEEDADADIMPESTNCLVLACYDIHPIRLFSIHVE